MSLLSQDPCGRPTAPECPLETICLFKSMTDEEIQDGTQTRESYDHPEGHAHLLAFEPESCDAILQNWVGRREWSETVLWVDAGLLFWRCLLSYQLKIHCPLRGVVGLRASAAAGRESHWSGSPVQTALSPNYTAWRTDIFQLQRGEGEKNQSYDQISIIDL